MELLRGITRRQEPVRLKTLCEAMRMKPSTAHNLLRTLASEGFVVSTDKGYVPGPALAELAGTSRDRAAAAHLEQAVLSLAAQFPEATVTYAEPRTRALAVVIRRRPEDGPAVDYPRDAALSYFATISGLVWLACSGPSERRRLLDAPLFEDEGLPLWKDRKRLETALDGLRTEDGGALPFQLEQSRRVAVLVRDAAGRPRGALGLCLPVNPDRPSSAPAADTLLNRLRGALARRAGPPTPPYTDRKDSAA
ncbi:MAG: helix-turn-helix domain-containing protein [Lentisphaerae bacterium]|nr:helix-turn-helix domain-containing protein [Lentisphaerota bacterium]